jgi:cytochrome c oxidase assembly protein subunit 11
MSGRQRGKTVTVVLAVSAICGMLGLTAASVPLYRLFCQVTGYGGTTQVAEALPEAPLARTIKVRFNADVDPALPWSFRPLQREVEVRIGEQNPAFFQARNQSDRPVVGQAVYIVTPFKAGPYFDKIACFCFDEQRLEPGQEVDMPVSFFVDPAILDDPNTRDLTTITLSYTFFRQDEDPASAVFLSHEPTERQGS